MFRLIVALLIAAAAPVHAAEKPFAFGPVRFEQNRGQVDARVSFLARARGQQVFLTGDGALFSPLHGHVVAMRFADAGKCRWIAEESASDSISYFIGNDRSKWVNMAPVFDRVAWHNAWPGVDVVFRGHDDEVEYDLMLAPGADPSQIHIQFDRPAQARVSSNGAVEIVSDGNVIRQRAPEIWQITAARERHKVQGRFVADGRNGFRLQLSGYERSRAVTVDPVLEMASYIGGENDDEIVAIHDGLMVGNTRSLVFPGAGIALRSSRDVFVRGTGQAQPGSPNGFYGTYVFGGSGDDEAAGIAAATSGNGFYVVGTTTSTDFPIAGIPGSGAKYKGGASDGFVAFIQTQQQRFLYLGYSFYVGGSGEDRITSFTGDGYVFALAGITDSPDLAAAAAPQTALAGGKDAFYGIFTGFSSNPLYGYLGGSADDGAYALALRDDHSLWIGGQTSSKDFPFAAGTLSGPSDAFLAEVSTPVGFYLQNAPISVKAWRIGGSGDDSIRALTSIPPETQYFNAPYLPGTVDGIGFAGVTTSTDLPVLNAAQPHLGGNSDGFVGTWDRAASSPRWLTYVGGSGPDEATAIAPTWSGDLYVGGWTGSTDLPVLNALQSASAGGEDGMFAAYDYSGALQHLTYFGGSGDDRIQGVAVAPDYAARVVGSTTSTDLPQQGALQDRGGGMDGFMADIGSDYFMGPTSLVVAKDGKLYFAVRPARTAFHVPVTFQSSDPSRVRIVYLGHSFDQVTAAPEDSIAVEGLADSGEADILVSSPGFTPKTIHVNLYPGAFLPSLVSGPLSTWSNEYLYANYCAVDPKTAAVVGTCMSLRNGAPAANVRWTVSDPTVFQVVSDSIGATELQILQPGTATLTLAVDGYTVLQSAQTITAAAPRPVPPLKDLHLGKDLEARLPITFAVNGVNVSSGYQGTLTARSGDPSRLLLSLDANQPGAAQVSAAMSRSAPTIWIQALADDGPAQVFLAVSGAQGETPITVVLEPAVVRWGTTQYGPQGPGFVDSISLDTGSQTTPLTLALQGVSGAAGQLRPGAAAPTLTMSNSNPKVVELNRLTVTVGDGTNYTVRGLAGGSSTLTLTSSDPKIPAVPASLPVNVRTSVPVLPTLSPVYVGNGLQTPVTFRYDPATAANVTVAVDDPSLALISSSATTNGTDHYTVQAGTTPSNDQYRIYIQGKASRGSTTVHIRFPEGESTFTVTLLPSGAGFQNAIPSNSNGYNGAVTVVTYALDPTTGIGVFQQDPQPGPGMPVHFSADAPVKLSMSSTALTSDTEPMWLYFTNPPAGQRATITVTTDNNPAVAAITSTLKIGALTPTTPSTLRGVVVPRDGIIPYDLPLNTPTPLTLTSSDPQHILLSTNATDAGSSSIIISQGMAMTVYIHGLGDSGSYIVRVDSANGVSSAIQVGLTPLQLTVYSNGSVTPVGGTTTFQASLNAAMLRPGVGPFHFTAKVTDPSIATVSPAAFDIGGSSKFDGTLTVSGVSTGFTQLIVTERGQPRSGRRPRMLARQVPPEVFVNPPAAPITVAQTPSALSSYTLGVNLQGSAQIDLGTAFANPNGAIVTLSSSDPGVLLLSRSATTAGASSVVVAVPVGTHLTQQIYLQGVTRGNSTIRMSLNGGPAQSVAAASVIASWVSCGAQPVSLNEGETRMLNCSALYSPAPGAPQLGEIGPRAGFTDLTLKLSSSAPDVFTVTPASGTLAANSIGVTITGVAPGNGVLKLTPPASFGPSPDGSEAVMVTVTEPPLTTNCSTENLLGLDTQLTFAISAAAGTVTATSSNASLVLVSTDENAAGSGSAAVAANGKPVSFTFQAVASYGTAEIVVSAPGYRDLRVAYALRQSEIILSGAPLGSPLSLKVGNSATLTVSMQSGQYISTPRAGAKIALDFAADQPGIVSFDPAHLLLNGPQSDRSVQVKGVAGGSTLIRMTAPTGYLTSGTPLAVSVVP